MKYHYDLLRISLPVVKKYFSRFVAMLDVMKWYRLSLRCFTTGKNCVASATSSSWSGIWNQGYLQNRIKDSKETNDKMNKFSLSVETEEEGQTQKVTRPGFNK